MRHKTKRRLDEVNSNCVCENKNIITWWECPEIDTFLVMLHLTRSQSFTSTQKIQKQQYSKIQTMAIITLKNVFCCIFDILFHIFICQIICKIFYVPETVF